MKLLLDEMHPPAAAQALRDRGFDVVAVAGITSPLKSLSDGDLLAEAALQQRALVTENIADFRTIASQWALDRRQHSGIIYTHSMRFQRASSAYPRNLIRALQQLLEKPPSLTETLSWEWWLEAPAG